MNCFLVDTCIWRDFYETRINKLGENISERAYRFIMVASKKKHSINISRITINELRAKLSQDEINNFVQYLSILTKTKIIEPENLEIEQASKLSITREVPKADCLIAIQAKNKGLMVVTRDKHFFNDLKDVCESVRSEDVS